MYLNRRRFLNLIGASTTIIGGIGTVGAQNKARMPLQAQLNYVRGRTKKYARDGGIQAAYGDGYLPAPGPSGNWVLTRPVSETVDLGEPVSLVYIEQDGGLELAGVGYAIPYTDNGHPDVFNDEDEDLAVSEDEGWTGFNNTLYVAFSNGNDEVEDITTLNNDVVFNSTNWRWTPEPVENGDTFDVDRDGTDELVDFARPRPPIWALHVWVHIDDPDGLFDLWYGDD